MRVILEFDGEDEDFEQAFDAMDDQFDIGDSIYYEIDYGDGEGGIHHTEFGDIKIMVERDKKLRVIE